MSAAFAGPLVLGILWDGVTKAGAFAGFATGAGIFVGTVAGAVPVFGSPGGLAYTVSSWLVQESGNSFSIAAIGAIAGCIVTFVISLVTSRLKRNAPKPG